MVKGIIASVVFLVIILTFFAYQSNKSIDDIQIEKAKIEIKILAENLDTPWAIDFLPDDRLIFTERSGRVSILKNEKANVVGTIDVSEVSESGLLGIAVDPEFEDNNFIYLYYTHDDGNRVSRFILNEKLEDEVILLDNIPNARFHDGGRIKFGPDGKLYITTGDATIPSASQNINSLAGKILRINKDGSVPEDNPFENYVYSYGHRNPQGIVWHPITNELYSSEHGPTRNDEINKIIKGGNYGWPTECDKTSEFIQPIRCYAEFTLAPSGIAFSENYLYVSGLRGTQLRKITFDGEKIVNEEALFEDLGRIRDVVEHDGYLYISTSNKDGRGLPRENDDKIIRIKL
ncbi:MAG TPA: PQQ-dependent sugar dehydrogenase [Candidatus Nanoarchaeia archaeon]|nr:PQQ-dependent sugar dehydrogenase [Candidatus Nanoarchaeia archaeon]